MPRQYIDKAVGILGQTALDSKRVSGFDPQQWLAWVQALIAALMQCKPFPQDGYDYLTWRPFWWVWGTPWSYQRRLDAHRDAVNALMATAFKRGYAGVTPSQDFEAVRGSVWEAIDAGKLNVGLCEGMYNDCRGF